MLSEGQKRWHILQNHCQEFGASHEWLTLVTGGTTGGVLANFCYKQHLSVHLVTTVYYRCNIIASFYIFYASSVVLTILLLKKPSN